MLRILFQLHINQMCVCVCVCILLHESERDMAKYFMSRLILATKGVKMKPDES